MSESPIVSIIGGTIWGNRGAESMLTTSIGMIREDYPEAKFYVFSYCPVKDRELIKDKSITVLSGTPISLVTRHFFGAVFAAALKFLRIKIPGTGFLKIARALNESDVLMDIGGISFSDGREKYLPYNFLNIWPAMMLGVKVVKIAQAMGPFKNPFNRILAKYFLPRCAYIFARGEQTAAHLKDLGIPEDRWEVATDIAFLYDPKYSLSTENEQKVEPLLEKLEKLKKQSRKIIVITPSILVERESEKTGTDYKEKLFKIVDYFKLQNAHFVFLPNATRESSEKTANNDLLTIQRLRQAAKDIYAEEDFEADFDWVTYDINSENIRRILAFADWLFTSRYHSMISGLCLGVSLVVIGWGHKYKETMNYFKLGKYCLDFNERDFDLIAYLDVVVKDQKDILRLLGENKAAVVSSAKKQHKFIRKLLF